MAAPGAANMSDLCRNPRIVVAEGRSQRVANTRPVFAGEYIASTKLSDPPDAVGARSRAGACLVECVRRNTGHRWSGGRGGFNARVGWPPGAAS